MTGKNIKKHVSVMNKCENCQKEKIYQKNMCIWCYTSNHFNYHFTGYGHILTLCLIREYCPESIIGSKNFAREWFTELIKTIKK